MLDPIVAAEGSTMSKIYLLLMTMPLLLAFRVSNIGCLSSYSRSRISLHATTARASFDSGDLGVPVERCAYLDIIYKFMFHEELNP